MALEPGDHVWLWNGNTSQRPDVPRAEWFPGSNPADPNDYLGNGKDIFNFVRYDDEIRRGRPQLRSGEGSFAWLDNNPGNITGKAGGANFGAYPDKFNWHNFLIFPTRDAGYDAVGALLRTAGYFNLTLTAAFRRYAPSSDGNDPVAYARAVASAASVDPDVSTIADLDNAGKMFLVQDKIADIEGEVAGDTFTLDDTNLPDEIKDLLA